MKAKMRRKLKRITAILFLIISVGVLALLGLIRVRTATPKANVEVSNVLLQQKIDLNKPVVDLSGWQPASSVDYNALSEQVIGAIVRVNGSYGNKDASSDAKGEDTAYKQHIQAFQERGIPVAVYAFVTGKTTAEMKQQAQDFYHRASPFHPSYYWLDVEVTNMKDMNGGIEAFRAELAKLGAKNIGIYAQDWFLKANQINVDKFSGIWIAAYGRNTGSWDASPETDLNYGMQQYTDQGSLNGYDGNLDLSLVRTQADYDKFFKSK
jgi:lysozyme